MLYFFSLIFYLLVTFLPGIITAILSVLIVIWFINLFINFVIKLDKTDDGKSPDYKDDPNVKSFLDKEFRCCICGMSLPRATFSKSQN